MDFDNEETRLEEDKRLAFLDRVRVLNSKPKKEKVVLKGK